MNGVIKVLDCTLRDGGYVNNWDFGREVIEAIIGKLMEAQIEILECGYLSATKETTDERTIYSSLEVINAMLKKLGRKCNTACMINFGEFPIEKLPNYSGEGVDILRVAFHRKDMDAAFDYSKRLKEKGYKVFLQPMITMNYSEEELKHLFNGVNEVLPVVAYIVDSFGTMRPKELQCLFEKFDARIDGRVAIGFHSHNNLQLSFSNAQQIINSDRTRDIVIDSSVFGMGRGAGNLCTELITLYLNENCGKSYNTLPILEIIDEYINPIFIHNPWGYSVPFYIASVNKCHPNYASYLVNKQTLKVKVINLLLSQIPAEEKNRYNPYIIEQLYINYLSIEVDDSNSISRLKVFLQGKHILLLAPGQTISTHKEQIQKYIKKESPLVIAINFVPNDYKTDFLFVSNLKRFSSLQEKLTIEKVIATSNIIGESGYIKVNYHTLIDPRYEEMDNAGIMLLRLLKRIGVKKVTLAGYDGFRANPHQNYYREELINSTTAEPLNDRNRCIATQLQELHKDMTITTLTPSLYF